MGKCHTKSPRGSLLDCTIIAAGLLAIASSPVRAQVPIEADTPAATTFEEAAPTEAAEGLNVTSILLDPVVISGGSTVGDYGISNGNTVVIVGTENIRVFRPTTVQDLFRGETAVAVGGTLTSNQKIYVHGIEETNLAVSIDGSRQNNKIFHHNATNIIDPQLLKAARVDAGVAPADAGPGALAGSIAYETVDVGDLLEGDRMIGGYVDAGIETNGSTFSKRGALYGRKDGFEFLGYLNGVDGDNYEDGDGNEVPGSEASLLSGLGKLAYEAESGDRVELSYERVLDDANRPYRANIGEVLGGRPVPETRIYDLDRQNVVLSYENTLASGLFDPRVVLAYSGTKLQTQEPILLDPSSQIVYDGETESFNGKAENDFNLDIGTVTVGVDAYADEAGFEGAGYTTSEEATNLGGYAQARIVPIDRLALSFGARLDHQIFTGVDESEQSNTGLSGNASAEYELTEYLSVKAGYSNVFGGIALAENFIQNPDWTYGEIDPVRGENAFAGFVVRYAGIILDVQAFDTSIRDGRVATFRGATLVEDFDSRGYDVALGYAWDTGYAQAKFTSVETEIGGDVADSFAGNYFTTPIGDILALSLVQRFPEWGLLVGGDTEIAFDESSTSVSGRELEGYGVVNLFAEYTPPRLENVRMRGEVKNLFDTDYSDRATYGQDFVDVRPLRQPGRSFGFSTRVTF